MIQIVSDVIFMKELTYDKATVSYCMFFILYS